MKDKLLKTHNLLAGIRPEQRTIEGQIASLEAELRKYEKSPNDWAREITMTKGQLSALRAQLGAKKQETHKQLLIAAQELETLLTEEIKKPVDLSDTKFVNALQVASLVNLDYAQATSLAEQFRGNHAALQLLKSKFTERQIDSGVDELIVSPSKIKNAIENSAFGVSSQGGSPTALIQLLGKTAKQFNIDLPAVEGDFTGAMHRAAGLPEPAPTD